MYKVRWREGTRNRSRSFARRRDAEAWDAHVRRLRQMRGAEEMLTSDVTLADYAAEWWATHAEPNLAARTLVIYGTALDLRILPAFGHLTLRQITPARVEEWIADLRKRGVGDPSVLKAATVLQAILGRAEINGLVDRNAVRSVRKPPQRRTREPEPVSPETVERIRAQLDPYDATLVSVLAYAGLRPESEAVTLTWGQVRERSLLIPASRKRGGRERSVRLLAPLAQDLSAWREASANTGARSLVFPRPDGDAWTGDDWTNWARRTYRPAARAAKLPEDTRPRDLRGSFASLLIAEGQTVVEVAQQLGHSAQTCLKDYARAFADYDPRRRRRAETIIDTARKKARETGANVPSAFPRRPSRTAASARRANKNPA